MVYKNHHTTMDQQSSYLLHFPQLTWCSDNTSLLCTSTLKYYLYSFSSQYKICFSDLSVDHSFSFPPFAFPFFFSFTAFIIIQLGYNTLKKISLKKKEKEERNHLIFIALERIKYPQGKILVHSLHTFTCSQWSKHFHNCSLQNTLPSS